MKDALLGKRRSGVLRMSRQGNGFQWEGWGLLGGGGRGMVIDSNEYYFFFFFSFLVLGQSVEKRWKK